VIDQLRRLVPRSGRGRLVAAAAVVLVIAAGVAVPLEVGGGAAAPAKQPAVAAHQCVPSGCALVDTVITSPRTIVFYGASCTGVYGTWYMNVVEGGPNNEPRPSYRLDWTFTPTMTQALPDGQVTVSPGSYGSILMTLAGGNMSITGTGTGSANPPSGHGRLIVTLSRSSATPRIEITETGLSSVESSLGLVSPFSLSGHPVLLKVMTGRHLSSC